MSPGRPFLLLVVAILLSPLCILQTNGALQTEYYRAAVDPHKARILMHAVDCDRFIDRRWFKLLNKTAPFDEDASGVSHAMQMRNFNVHVNVRDNPNSGKSACRLWGEAAVDTLAEMARRKVPFDGFTFSRAKDARRASAFYQAACLKAFDPRKTPFIIYTGGADGWPVSADWKRHFKLGLMWAKQLPSFFPPSVRTE